MSWDNATTAADLTDILKRLAITQRRPWMSWLSPLKIQALLTSLEVMTISKLKRVGLAFYSPRSNCEDSVIGVAGNRSLCYYILVLDEGTNSSR